MYVYPFLKEQVDFATGISLPVFCIDAIYDSLRGDFDFLLRIRSENCADFLWPKKKAPKNQNKKQKTKNKKQKTSTSKRVMSFPIQTKFPDDLFFFFFQVCHGPVRIAISYVDSP